MTKKDLEAEKRAAELRRAEARSDAQSAKSAAKEASREMSEISGVGERARSVRDSVEAAHDKFVAWDAARERRFNARLDEADAKLREWKASYKVAQAEEGMREHDALTKLEEQASLARARYAAWNSARHERKAEEALEDAARHLDEAYDAASSRYER